MNFDDAIAAHAAWKTKLRTLINAGQGEVDEKKLGSDNACPVGQWLYGEGQRHASQPGFAAVRDNHKRFHQLAGSVAVKAKAGQKAAAAAILDSSEYGQASLAVVQAIAVLRKAVEGR